MEEEKALAQVSIPKDRTIHEDGNILTPTKKCCVITTAGQIWDIEVHEFQAREELLRETWNTDRSQFTKREL